MVPQRRVVTLVQLGQGVELPELQGPEGVRAQDLDPLAETGVRGLLIEKVVLYDFGERAQCYLGVVTQTFLLLANKCKVFLLFQSSLVEVQLLLRT